MSDEFVGKFFGRLRGEEAGMRIFERVELGVHRRDDFGVRVAETGDGRAAGGVDVVLAGLVANENTLA